MMRNGNYRDRKAAIIAASITFGVALIILVLLFVLTVGDDRRMLAESSTPELQDDEEIFYEPEMLIVEHKGDEKSDLDIEEAALQPSGIPEPAEAEQPERVVRNEVAPKEETPAAKPKLVATEKPAEVKTATPQLSREEEKQIASMSSKFKSENNGGFTSGETNGSVSTSGQLNGSGNRGRRMESCPSSSVKASQKVVVTVKVVVTEKGTVKSATATGGNQAQRNACQQMAMKSRWTPREGAGDVAGTITFTIIPKS